MKKKFSKEEAVAIFERAAGRQRQADSESDEYLTAEELEEAGKAAGIGPSAIRAAISDLARPDRYPTYRTSLGVPIEYLQTIVIPDATPEEVWKRVVPMARDAFETEGWMDERPGEYHWFNDRYGREGARIVFEREGNGTRLSFKEGRKKAMRKTFYFMGAFTVIGALVALVLFFSGVTWLSLGSSVALPAYLVGGGVLLRLRKVSRESIRKLEALLGKVERRLL